MRTISIANQKGGCGKTTTAINLSACLAHQGKRVLLIDMDPQGHVALGLNISTSDRAHTVFDILNLTDGDKLSLTGISEKVSENFHVVPSDISLSTLDQHLSMVEGRESRLKQAIMRIHSLYDMIIIDCPPNLGLLTFNALIASTEVLVPIEMSLFSLHGISKLVDIIASIKNKTGHEIHVKALGTMVDMRTRIAREVLENIREHFREAMFETLIRSNVTLKEAAGFGKAILDYSKTANGFKDYGMLAKEVLSDEKTRHQHLAEGNVTSKLQNQFTFYAPEANSVKIGGNFNNWNPTDEFRMERDDSGTWTKHISLKPGTYEYRFIVDGEWIEDHANSNYVSNAYGDKNSVLKIG